MTPTRRLLAVLLVIAVGAVVLIVATSGSSDNKGDAAALKGTVVAGPGVRAVPPPFPPEKAHLAERIRLLGLPAVGKEKFHQHALMSVLVDGLLVKAPTNMGLDYTHKIF